MKKLNFRETFETGISTTLCVGLTKEEVRENFKKAKKTPKNGDMEPDENYVSGEVQYIIDKGTDNVGEILIFPTYADDKGVLSNGDFIDAGDSWWEHCDEALKYLADQNKEV